MAPECNINNVIQNKAPLIIHKHCIKLIDTYLPSAQKKNIDHAFLCHMIFFSITTNPMIIPSPAKHREEMFCIKSIDT